MSFLYMNVHTEVSETLELLISEKNYDITLPAIVRFLISHGRQEDVRDTWYVDATYAIGQLDATYLSLSDGKVNGRKSLRLSTKNDGILSLDPEDAYTCLFCGMFDFNFGLDTLELFNPYY